jgi:hypothetical protein
MNKRSMGQISYVSETEYEKFISYVKKNGEDKCFSNIEILNSFDNKIVIAYKKIGLVEFSRLLKYDTPLLKRRIMGEVMSCR